MIRFIALAISFVLAAQVQADSRLDQALDDYLSDRDDLALPVLAELAAAGNVNVQILLARLRASPASPFMLSMSATDRRRLMTSPTTPFGKSWLTVASSNGNSLANALQSAFKPPWNIAHTEYFLEIGWDTIVARQLLHFHRSIPADDLRALFDDPRLGWDIKEIIPLKLFVIGALSAEDLPRLEALAENDPSGHMAQYVDALLRRGEFLSEYVKRRAFSQLSGVTETILQDEREDTANLLDGSSSRPYQRVRMFCERVCPDELDVCIGDAFALLGGVDAPWWLGSPYPKLISETDYVSSKRALVDFSRQVALMRGFMPEEWRIEMRTASCAARVSLPE